MLPVQFIRDEKARVKISLEKRSYKDPDILDRIIEADDRRKNIQKESDEKKAEMNRLSKEIGLLMKDGQKEAAETAKSTTVELKSSIEQLDNESKSVQDELQALLLLVPNCLNSLVPFGKSADDNEVYKDCPNLPELPADALPHWELAAKYKLIDFETGVKITGAGFPLYTGKGAKLQRALINFFLDEAEKVGYIENMPPHMVNAASAMGTGQLPDKEGQMYYCQVDDLYLIPTAEVPLTNIYRDVILDEEQFPIKITGYTPCFRREAGSYGSHVRGLNRLHQFDKVEIVCIEHPDRSHDRHIEMIEHVEGLLHKLGLPYRILRLCGGDTGFASSMTFDFETFSAAQKRWLEVSSVSNFDVFQSNRLKLRFKTKDGKGTQLAHTLNGSALALPRIVATLLENNQTSEGIIIPEVLRKYTGFDMIS
jgi:seryl-tRNA synthetase